MVFGGDGSTRRGLSPERVNDSPGQVRTSPQPVRPSFQRVRASFQRVGVRFQRGEASPHSGRAFPRLGEASPGSNETFPRWGEASPGKSGRSEGLDGRLRWTGEWQELACDPTNRRAGRPLVRLVAQWYALPSGEGLK